MVMFITVGLISLIKTLAPFVRNHLIRFVFVGAVNALFGLTIFALSLNLLKLNYAISLAITYVFGIIFNFFSTGYVVFDNLRFRFLIPFIIVYLSMYCVNFILLKVLSINGIGAVHAQALLIIPMALMTFFSLRQVFGDYGKK